MVRVVVLGATGHVGSRLVRQAAEAGHEVVAYARRPEAVQARPGVTVVAGGLDDVDTLAAAAAGADVVVSTVGGGFKDTTFLQRTLPPTVRAVQQAGGPRLVVLSVLGAGDTAGKASWYARLVYRTVLRSFLDDRVQAERLLAASGLDTTVVFPVNLKDVPALGRAGVVPLAEVGKVPGMPTLPMDDAARAVLEIATTEHPSGARLLVTTPDGWRPAVR